MSSGKQDPASQEKKTEFLQIRISPSKKREIEKFLEEKGFRSLTSFVLFAVDFYMTVGVKIEKMDEILETQKEILELLKKKQREERNKKGKTD